MIPDTNFEQALIDLGYDVAPLDNMVPTANINAITDLDIQNKGISDLTGIEDFLNLSVLSCENNVISTLDVTQNTNLTQLFCSNNLLSNIDVSTLVDLQILWCGNNQLSNVDVSNNTQLISLVCNDNLLTNLDVSNNLILNVLVLEMNQISILNTSQNSTLSTLNCSSNTITSLDVSNNLNLVNLNCSLNQLNSLDVLNNSLLNYLDVSFNGIEVLDLSQNSQLIEVDGSNNNLCRLNIKNSNNIGLNVLDFSNNINLNCVVVDNASAINPSWIPTSFTNYVNNVNDCDMFVNVDTLDDFIGTSYTLPLLTYGNYYTASDGSGTPLFSGNIITTSQTIYIYNETICYSNESSFNVLITTDSYYIPKYFTPNNDGNHDLWLVKDFSNNMKEISIFNHYGKLLKYLEPGIGWDGTFNGKPMETNDFWYIISFKNGETIRGHFTLKR
jgi:gliding motility-associated-like protein